MDEEAVVLMAGKYQLKSKEIIREQQLKNSRMIERAGVTKTDRVYIDEGVDSVDIHSMLRKSKI